MKTKLVVLSCAVASLALFSFAPKETKTFELQANGNYKVNADNMSDKDINYLIENTQNYSGEGIFKQTFIFTTTIKDGSVKETVVANETTNPEPPKDDIPQEMLQIIAKYNN